MTPPPKRRLLRFSLRTMLVVVTVLCVLLGWKVHKVNKQKRVVAWVEEMGGEVFFDYDDLYWEKSEIEGNENTPISNLTPLTNLTNLEYLSLWDTQATDDEIANLQKALPNCKIVR